jgi:predicted nucleic acid-binding Zn ribbon protein
MEARENCVAQSVTREHERFKAKAAYLDAERQKLDEARAAHYAAEASSWATKRVLKLCLLVVLHGPSGGASGSTVASADQTQRIARICSEHAQEVANFEEERRKLMDDHQRLQCSLEERLREQEETLLSYSDNLSELPASLENCATREREILQKASQREAKLQGELEILQNQMAEAKMRL